jgi:hypothetical protein
MPSPFVVQNLPSDLLGRYKEALWQKDPHLLERFERTLRDMPGAAHLEAMTYAAMDTTFGMCPEIHDHPSDGGADLKLTADVSNVIYQECKYLERSAVAEESRLDDCDPLDMVPVNYSHITGMIQTKVKNATAQLADEADGAGIAVIGTDHRGAQEVLDDMAAEWLLTSTTHIEVPISRRTGSAVRPAQAIAPLRNSVFLARPPQIGDDLRRLRVPVSAVLLYWFDVSARWGTMIGCLNPWPLRSLDIHRFPGVPFARFASTPTITDRILPAVEWVVG